MIGLIDCRSTNLGRGWAGAQPELLEFFDRPLLQHAVEQMVQRGVTHCVLIAEDTSSVMLRWGTGERWGCTFSAIPPRAIVSFLVRLGDQPVMIGRGDCIPCLPQGLLRHQIDTQTKLLLRSASQGDEPLPVFTGWAMTQAGTLLNRCFATHGATGLLAIQESSSIMVSTCICCDTPQGFLHAQKTVLDATDSEVIFHGAQIRPGLWVSRNVVLHPSVRSEGKVYLGENVRIGPNVLLVGPLVVGRNSVIDANSVLEGSSVQPGTYLGRNMSLHNDIIHKSAIIRSQIGVAIKVDEPNRLARTDMTWWDVGRALFGTPIKT